MLNDTKVIEIMKIIGVKAQIQLNDGFDGAIVPMDNQSCAEEIVKIIVDKKLQNEFVENMKSVDYSNEAEINKLYKLIGD